MPSATLPLASDPQVRLKVQLQHHTATIQMREEKENSSSNIEPAALLNCGALRKSIATFYAGDE